MKVCLLSAADSVHTVRWANGLSAAGASVSLISLTEPKEKIDPRVNFYVVTGRRPQGYIQCAMRVRRLVQLINPDILNAHYASGYGLLALIVNFHPWVLSVWGSDIFEFPHRSFLHQWLIRKNLEAADGVASTSAIMASEVNKYTKNPIDIAITPFGIDLTQFEFSRRFRVSLTNTFTIGTIKTLEPQYGIDTLLHAFSIFLRNVVQNRENYDSKFELRISGDGIERSRLGKLCQELKISEFVTFVGLIAHRDVPAELARLDVFAALSRRESFGVAALEAAAVGLPVIVSDAPGFRETTLNNVTGFIVPIDDALAAAKAMYALYKDPILRLRMGREGRTHVEKNYSWESSISKMQDFYLKVLKR
jgi:glycosyltransferase involved in cell wall biosynthesis